MATRKRTPALPTLKDLARERLAKLRAERGEPPGPAARAGAP
ncbi:hypothetical protein ACLESO_24430 [Pyxidicoccus sp. 3LG]